MTLSVCMIVKDEEDVLHRALDCASKFADEIIVVDTGSTDQTKQVARSFTDKVYDFEWVDDFSAARNFSFSKATCDFVMWLDADDILLNDDIKKINKLKKDMQADLYMFEYVLSHEADMTPIFKYMRERVFKRSKNYQWVDPIHEVIVPTGKIEKCDIKIYHEKLKLTKPGRNLEIYRKLIEKKLKFSPRQQFYYSRELMFNSKYSEAVKEFNRFLRRNDGWVENKIQACIDLAFCYDQLGLRDKARESLLKSFCFAPPRSEATYRLGNIFLSENKFDEAIYWFERSLTPPNFSSGAFVESDMHEFLPLLELTYVYSLKGDLKNSYKYHKLTKQLRPNDPAVVHNDTFFANHFEKTDK